MGNKTISKLTEQRDAENSLGENGVRFGEMRQSMEHTHGPNPVVIRSSSTSSY